MRIEETGEVSTVWNDDVCHGAQVETLHCDCGLWSYVWKVKILKSFLPGWSDQSYQHVASVTEY